MLNEFKKETVTSGGRIMYRKFNGSEYQLIVRPLSGGTLVGVEELPTDYGNEKQTVMLSNLPEDVQEDVRHALENCYCDAVTHCDHCSGRGFRNLYRHLNTRSDTVAKARRKRFAVIDGGVA
jgi:hypothetical protein